MIRDAITVLVSGGSLTMEEAALVMEEIMGGEVTRLILAPLLPP